MKIIIFYIKIQYISTKLNIMMRRWIYEKIKIIGEQT